MKHILRKVLSLFMVFIVLMGIQPTTVYAETNPWEGEDISDFVGFIMTGYSRPDTICRRISAGIEQIFELYTRKDKQIG